MFPIKKFRIANDCDFNKSFDYYIRTNYPLEVFNQCQPFIKDLSQTRNLIGYLSINQSESQIDSTISKCVSYIKTLLELNSVARIERNSLNIEFKWREVRTNQVTTSNNLYYEICSVKYNIAVLLMTKGYLHINSKDKNELKEAYKNFIKAAGIYEEITNLCNTYYVTKENIPDFGENLLYACKNYALGMGQIAIFKLSEGAFGSDLLQKLLNGIYLLFKRALNVNLDNQGDRGEIQYLCEYYFMKSLLYYKMGYEKIYNQKGNSIGIIIGLEEYIVDNLKKLESNKNKYGTHEQHSEVTNLLRTMQSELENYKYKNNLVNKEKVDARDAVENMPSLIKAQVPENKFDLDVPSLLSLSSIKKSLINPKVKPMIDRYIYEMRKYVDGNIYNYQTPQKIDDFINKKGLNDIFGYYGGASVLTNEVFRDIQEIQNLGGLGGLLSKFKLINNEYHSLQTKINQIKDMYTREELENENYIKMYGDKWNLPLDPTYKNTLNELLNELNAKRQNDISLSSIIMNDKEFYNLLQFKEKAEIEAKIPKDLNQVKMQSSPLIEQLQKNVNILYEKKSTISNLINGLYSKINNDWPLDDFNQAAKNIKSESSVIQEQKNLMTNDFKEIEKVSNEIVALYPLIEKDYDEYVRQTGFKGNIVNNKYLQFFNNLKTNYQRHSMELDRRLKEYNDFGKKIDDIGRSVNDHLQARNFMKSEALEKLEHEFRLAMANK
jgi:hypothetical protein